MVLGMSDNYVKVVATIPVTRELLIDAGLQGPLAKPGPDAARYRQMWHDRPLPVRDDPWRSMNDLLMRSMFRQAPPWEAADPPALPMFRVWGKKPVNRG